MIPISSGRARAQQALDTIMAREVESIRTLLVGKVDDNSFSMLDFMEAAIQFWREWLDIDRIIACDVRSGSVVAGWNKGNNLARLQEWDGDYVPLEDDRVLQQALESDELVAVPTPGVGMDMAFTLPLDNGEIWLIAFDQTQVAREFSRLDMAYVALVRDLLIIKSRLVLHLAVSPDQR